MSEARAEVASETFIEEFQKLDDRGRRIFTESLQELQRHCFVLRGGAIRSDPRYSFIEKNEELVSSYLALSGWRLHLDRELGVARMFHPENSGKVRFKKDETIALLVLRLLYHENKQKASESPDTVITVGTLREKMHQLLPEGTLRPFLGRKVMGNLLRRFEHFRIVSFPKSSFQIDDDTLLVLEPVLEHLVAANSVEGAQRDISERMNRLLGQESAAEQSAQSTPDEEGEEG